jgi:magnesium transporter
MITAYVRNNGMLSASVILDGQSLPENTLWVDLLAPSRQEEAILERELALQLPSREEMSEIEISSRLYQENGAQFMTATLLLHADTIAPSTEPVTFILTAQRVVTIRFADPKPFQSYSAQVQRQFDTAATGEDILVGLLDAIIDRIADLLERVQHDMNEVSLKIFSREKTDYEEVLRMIGLAEGLTSRARESLVSMGRVVSFLSRPGQQKHNKARTGALKTLSRDVMSLSDHSSFLANNINFMLNTALGMSNIEQTDIIKIFSVMAVVFMPPTLIASIYGMNFKMIPELGLEFGYPMSLVMMVISGVLPYVYFKSRGWL